MAETKGFEPSKRVNVYSLSRGAPSTTRPRLRRRVYSHPRPIHKGFFLKLLIFVTCTLALLCAA